MGCGVTVELVSKPSLGDGFRGAMGLFGSATLADGGLVPSFSWVMDSRGLVAAWVYSDGGTGSSIVAAPAAAWPRWLRIEESGGRVVYRTAAAGMTTFTTAL